MITIGKPRRATAGNSPKEEEEEEDKYLSIGRSWWLCLAQTESNVVHDIGRAPHRAWFLCAQAILSLA